MKVLYIGHDFGEPSEFCPGSTLCLALVEKITTIPIRVQNCDILRKHQELPAWLNGTPILIDDEDEEALRGTQAVRYLQSVVRREEETVREEAPSQTAGGRIAAQATPRLTPAQTRQPSARPRGDASQPPREQDVESAMLEEEELNTAQDATANGAGMENVPLGSGKIDDTDLQRFMEARKKSPASAGASSPS